MKRSHILGIFIGAIISQSPFLVMTAFATNDEEIIIGQPGNYSDIDRYVAELDKCRKYVEVVSGGRNSSNRVLIRVGNHVFFKNIPHSRTTAGLYVVGIFNNKVLLQSHYNMFADGKQSTFFLLTFDHDCGIRTQSE